MEAIYYKYNGEKYSVLLGEYTVKPPLVKPSRLSASGAGKALSDGWAVNFAAGCLHGCPFCYVDSIQRRFNPYKLPREVVERPWGSYLLVPANIEEAIARTPWGLWRGQLVLMSSMHDPYLPQLYPIPRRILEAALPQGVRFLIQTRSALVLRDLDLLAKYRDQVIVQVSIATLDEGLASAIEPGVPPPRVRLEVLRRAKEAGLRVGAIVAPVVPPNRLRPDVEADLEAVVRELAKIGADQVFGEMLHARGDNLARLKRVMGDLKIDAETDWKLGELFTRLLRKYGLRGQWWYEYKPR